jgi:hypothetical protein
LTQNVRLCYNLVRNFGSVFGHKARGTKMKHRAEDKKNDDSKYDMNIPKYDANKLLDIIHKHNSLWAVAACSYNLGRHRATPKS